MIPRMCFSGMDTAEPENPASGIDLAVQGDIYD